MIVTFRSDDVICRMCLLLQKNNRQNVSKVKEHIRINTAQGFLLSVLTKFEFALWPSELFTAVGSL